MPKLNKNTAKKVSTATSDFEPLPEDNYLATLMAVEVKQPKPVPGQEKSPYWSWEFRIESDEFKGRKMWVNTSMSEKALWKLNEVFQAFGVEPDTHTDELLGKTVTLTVVQSVIEQGSRKGQLTNQVSMVLPDDMAGTDDDESFEADDDDDEMFDE